MVIACEVPLAATVTRRGSGRRAWTRTVLVVPAVTRYGAEASVTVRLPRVAVSVRRPLQLPPAGPEHFRRTLRLPRMTRALRVSIAIMAGAATAGFGWSAGAGAGAAGVTCVSTVGVAVGVATGLSASTRNLTLLRPALPAQSLWATRAT